MDGQGPSNQSAGRRIVLSLATALMMLIGGIVFVFLASDNGELQLPQIDWNQVDVLRYVGYFLVVDGLLSFFGGLIYLATKPQRILESPKAAQLKETLDRNLSLQSNQEAEKALHDLQKSAYTRGLVFMISGLVSLVIAGAILSGLFG